MEGIGVGDHERVMVPREIPGKRNVSVEEDPGMERADGEEDEKAV